MEYKKILPEIVAGLGKDTVFDNPGAPDQRVIKLHINIENWYGDDLLWNFPEVIVTEKLKKALEKADFTGFEFADMKVTKDVYFKHNYQLGQPLPKFFWMKVTGSENRDDIFLKDWELYISNAFLDYLKDNHHIDNVEVNPVYDREMTDFIHGLVEKDRSGDSLL